MALKLNGKALNLHPEPPTITKLRAALDKSKHDDLFTAEEIAKKAGISPNFLGSSGIRQFAEIDRYSHILSKRRVFGNPRAILALREEIRKQAEAEQ